MKINNTVSDFVANREKAHDLAIEIDKKLSLYDFIVKKQCRIISIKHGDGSYLEFHSACFRKLNKEWMAVFTEHHGTHIYHYEDVKDIEEWFGKGKHKILYHNKEW
jgi:hypothetical protein